MRGIGIFLRSFIMANELLMAYSVLDESYQNGLIKKIEGEPAAVVAETDSITDPDETYVPLGPNEGDPKVFSYALGREPAILVARVTTPGPGTQPSSCLYTLAAPEAGCGKAWKVLSRDVVLKSGGAEMASNPYGAAQVGNMLYIIDCDSQKITLLGVNELNGVPAGDHALSFAPFDLGPGSDAALPASAKGQAIITVKDGNGNPFLFALFTDWVPGSPYPTHSPSILVKIAVGPYGVLSFVEKIDTLAKNAQELIYIAAFDGTGSPGLLIPCIGGPQQQGATNLDNSKLELVRPFVTPVNPGDPTMNTKTLLKGDNPVPETPTWDIRAFAAAPDVVTANTVFILTGTADASYNQNWRLYGITLTNLRNLTDKALSQATGLFTVDEDTDSPGYYWDLYYENGTAYTGDRLWFLKGSPIVIGPVNGYSTAAKKTFDTGYAQGQIGGLNVDSATLVSETMKQAALGISLKRGLRGIAPVVPPEEEAAEEEK
jgi:hypothetical protein